MNAHTQPPKPYYADQSLGARITRQIVFGFIGTGILLIGVGSIYNGFREGMPSAIARRDELAVKHTNRDTIDFVAEREYRDWFNSPEQQAVRAAAKAEKDRQDAETTRKWVTWFQCKSEIVPQSDGTYREEWCTAPWNMK
jgi:hypothetical protein